MKKSIFTIATLVGFLVLTSCGGNENKIENTPPAETVKAKPEAPKEEPKSEASIVGVWKLSDVDLGMTPPKGKEKVLEDLKKEMIAKTIYTFGQDGVLNMESNIGKSSGTYTLEGDKLTSVTNGKSSSTNVQSLTESELVLTMEERGTKMVMKFKK